MLEIEVREAAAGITVIRFSGRITTGPECESIEVLVRKLLGENRKKLIFDLSGVDHIDRLSAASLAAERQAVETRSAFWSRSFEYIE